MEILVVMAILAIVASIAHPPIARAIRNGRATASLANLRQLHLALKMYQQDHGGDGVFGGFVAMGLPPEDDAARIAHARWGFGLPKEIWRSPCGRHPDLPDAIQTVERFYFSPEDFWAPLAIEHQDNIPVFADLHCSEPDVRIQNKYYPRRGLGVLLSGQLIHRNSPGDLYDIEWWIPSKW